MKQFLWVSCFLVAISGAPTRVSGQNAFTRQVPCPGDLTISGYTNIANLNADMTAELNRVTTGGTAPQGGYSLILCPGTFNVAGGNAIKPVLNQVSISCGGPSSVNSVCTIVGSEQQLVIQNPTVQGYRLSSVQINGLTFTGFGPTSAKLTASAPTVFTCIDCKWQHFTGTDNVVDLTGTMTMQVENGVIGVSALLKFKLEPRQLLLIHRQNFSGEHRSCKCKSKYI